jgi:hypothetical protein
MEGNLEDVMKVSDRAVAADQNPSPDGWIDPPQHEVELVDFRRVADLGHDGLSSPVLPFPVSTRFFQVSNFSR